MPAFSFHFRWLCLIETLPDLPDGMDSHFEFVLLLYLCFRVN